MQETKHDGTIEATELEGLKDPKLEKAIKRLDLRKAKGVAVGQLPSVGEVHTINGLQYRVTKRLKRGRLMLKLVGQ